MALAFEKGSADMAGAVATATTDNGAPPTPRQCLKANTVGSLVAHKCPLVEINCNDNIDDALRKLQKFNLTCAPVFDAERNEYIGLVSTYDIMIYIAFGFFRPDEQSVSLSEMDARRRSIAEVPVGDLAGTADFLRVGWWDRAGLVVHEPTLPVYDAMESIVGGVGRVLVRTVCSEQPPSETGPESRSIDHRMLSESDLLRFVCQNSVAFHGILGQSLSSLRLGQPGESRVVSVSSDLPTLSAFRRMFQSKADAVAVVNADGVILTTLSPSDLRGIRLATISDLLMPVGDFLSKRRFGTLAPPLAVSPNASLLTTAAVAIMGAVHRVWVVDKSGKPVGCVRITDMLRAVYKAVADEQ